MRKLSFQIRQIDIKLNSVLSDENSEYLPDTPPLRGGCTRYESAKWGHHNQSAAQYNNNKDKIRICWTIIDELSLYKSGNLDWLLVWGVALSRSE